MVLAQKTEMQINGLYILEKMQSFQQTMREN